MEKQIINVPKEIRYISEWNDFDITLLQGHSIINKFLTGCGFTHYSLTNDIPTILCSPRKFLLENKCEQLSSVHLVINKGEKSLDIDGEVMKEDKFTNLSSKNTSLDFEYISSLKRKLSSYLLSCQFEQIVPKILVTYDSLKYVLEVIGENISNYSIIVDEFQNIFMDSRFKASIELNFVEYLQSCPNVTYLSATPYIEEYLNELDEFKSLPYYEFKWHPDKIRTIDIVNKKTYHISKEVDKIISNYLTGSFPTKITEDGVVHLSKEVVFYVNSVRMICNIIKRNNLTPDQVNIICADTPKNLQSLSKIHPAFTIGKAPLKGEVHKMFTFCTRTTYVGADFYSTSALSVIVSDCKIESLSADIRMDFPQIMGRQRLKENVFRDECIFIYKLSDKELTEDSFETLRDRKLQITNEHIKNFEAIRISNPEGIKEYLDLIRLESKTNRYTKSYTGVNEKSGTVVINKLVMLSEKRAFELRSNVYKSEVNIYNEFGLIPSLSINSSSILNEILELEKIYKEKGSFELKMRFICEFLIKNIGIVSYQDLKFLKREHLNYLYLLGPEKIKALGYFEANIKREIKINDSESLILEAFKGAFIVGGRYTLKYIKNRISEIYKELGLTKTSKASDIEEFFEVKRCTIIDSGKRVNGYEILSLK